jgi:hypothetical protein
MERKSIPETVGTCIPNVPAEMGGNYTMGKGLLMSWSLYLCPYGVCSGVIVWELPVGDSLGWRNASYELPRRKPYFLSAQSLTSCLDWSLGGQVTRNDGL